MRDYIRYCGAKSVVFQWLLAAWLGACVGFGILLFIAGRPTEMEFRGARSGWPEHKATVAGWYLSSVACPGTLAVLFGLPLVVGAVAR